MAMRSDQPIDVETPTALRAAPIRGAIHAEGILDDETGALARSAVTFAVRCHAGRMRDSDGASSIEHPLEVARLLRDAGCSKVVVAAGLLHDVLEDTRVSAGELNARFGARIANVVQAVTDHASTHSYRQRKQVLRAQVRSAGGDAALVFAADRISNVRQLPNQVLRDRTRFGDSPRASRMRSHLERHHQMRLEHYSESLEMLQQTAPKHPLVKRFAIELKECEVAFEEYAT